MSPTGLMNGAYKFLGSFYQMLLQTVFSMANLTYKGGLGFIVSAATFTGTVSAGVYMGHFTGKSSFGDFNIVFGVPAPDAGAGVGFVVAAALAFVGYRLWQRPTQSALPCT